MSIAIEIGKKRILKKHGVDHVDIYWPGIYLDTEKDMDEMRVGREIDGTSDEFSIYSGMPILHTGNKIIEDWFAGHSAVRAFFYLFGNYAPVHDDPILHQIDAELIKAALELPERGVASMEVNLAIWFKYWLRRAREAFGEDAFIELSKEE